MTGAARDDVEFLAERERALAAAVGTVLVGQETALRLAFMTLVCAGHALLEPEVSVPLAPCVIVGTRV